MDSPDQDQSAPSRGGKQAKKLLLVSLGAAVVLSAAVAAVALTSEPPAPETSVADVVSSCQRQDSRVDINCVHSAIALLPTDKPAELPGLLLAQVQSHADMSEDCHNLMHTLGRHLADQASDLAASLVEEWEPCGYGFLHGVFESQRVPDNPGEIETQLSALCKLGQINKSERLQGECYHALGHAVSDSQTDILSAIDVCKRAFTEPGNGSSSARIGCYSGVAMKERDKVLYEMQQGLEVGPTVDDFYKVGAVCELEGQEFTLGCAPGFVQVATEYGPSHIEPFLTWCSELLGEQAKTCYEQAGIYMGHYQERFYPVESSVKLCEAGDPQQAAACSVSITQGLVIRGYPAEEAVTTMCQAFNAVFKGDRTGDGQRLCTEATNIYLNRQSQ